VEVQARQVRSKLRERMVNATNAAMGGGAGQLHKARLAQSVWPPPSDKEGLLAGVPQPQSLREVVAVMSRLVGCENELEAVCGVLAEQDREVAERMRSVEERRLELTQAEDRNERLRREAATIESTGGEDSAEHLTLREQLTEMQAQGIAINAAESRHAVLLEHCAASTASFLSQLSGEPVSKFTPQYSSSKEGISQMFALAHSLATELLSQPVGQ